jgi:ribosomal 30S subunit maturation factor RimM
LRVVIIRLKKVSDITDDLRPEPAFAIDFFGCLVVEVEGKNIGEVGHVIEAFESNLVCFNIFFGVILKDPYSWA